MLTDAAMHMASLPPRKRLAMQQHQDCYSNALPRDAETHSLKAEGDVPQQALTPTLLPVPAVKKKRTALASGGAKAALAPIVMSPEAAEAASRAAALRAKAQAAIQNAVAARQVCAAAWPGGAGRQRTRPFPRVVGTGQQSTPAQEHNCLAAPPDSLMCHLALQAAELAQRLAETATAKASAWAQKQLTQSARAPTDGVAAAADPVSDEELARRLHCEMNATGTRRARSAAPTPPGASARRLTAGPVSAAAMLPAAAADDGMVGAHAVQQQSMQQDGCMEGRSPSHSATESLSGDTTAAALGSLECTAAAGLVPPPLAKVAAACDTPTDHEDGQPDTAKVLAHACAADGDHMSGDGHLEQHALAVVVVMGEEHC